MVAGQGGETQTTITIRIEQVRQHVARARAVAADQKPVALALQVRRPDRTFGAARLLCPWDISRQEYWSGLPLPSPGNLPNPGIERGSPALQADSLPSEPPEKPL